MFIAKNNNLIITQANTREELLQKVKYMQYDTIVEIEEALHLVNGRYVTTDEAKQLEKERIQALSMTPLDFIKALEEVGVSYSQIKELCNTNEEVEKQLRFCNHVYRGNPLLDKLCGSFNVTTEQLNELFKKYGT